MAARVPEPDPIPAVDIAVDLTPMRRRHLRSVLRIESQVYPRPWTLSLFMSELALRTSRAYYVARVDGAVAGYAGMMFVGEDSHITTIAVDPGWHRHKIGTRLMLHLVREALRRDTRHMTLEVRVTNRGAQNLYRKFGFRPAGIRKNYYAETNEDALVMWADDVNQAAYVERLRRIESGVPGTTTVSEGR